MQMRTRKWLFGLLVACLSAGITSCAGSGVGQTDPSVATDGKEDTPAPPLDSAILQQITDTLNDLRRVLVEDKSAQKSAKDFLNDVYQLLKSRPVVEKWGMEPANSEEPELIFATFRGGMRYILEIYWDKDSTTDSPVYRSRAREAKATVTGDAALSTMETPLNFSPSKTHVVGEKMLFADLTGEFNTMGATLAAQLDNKYGYTGITVGKPNGDGFGNVDSFKNLGQYSFVYIGGHGRYFQELNIYTIPTTESWTTARNELFWAREDFQDGRVTFGDFVITSKGKLQEIGAGEKYRVTTRFLDKYMTAFPDNSVAIFDLCGSTAKFNTEIGSISGTSLPATMKAKNLTTMFGWNFSVRNRVTKFLMGYLFNKALVEYDEANPSNIPHSLDEVYADASSRGFTVDSIVGAVFQRLKLKKNAPDFFLRPSMKEIRVDPSQKGRELTISGMVGEDGGEVCFGQDCRAVSAGADWVDETVTTALPDDFIGPITVKVKGHPSNQLIINEWRGSMEMLWTGEKICTTHATLNFRMRCEFSKKRNELTGPLTDPFCGTQLAQDSALSYFVDGKWTDNNELTECSGEGRLTGSTLSFTSAGLNVQKSVFMIGGMAYSDFKRTNLSTGAVTTGKSLAFVPMSFSFTCGRDGVIQAGNYSLPSNGSGAIEWRWDTITPHFGIAP